MLGEDLSLVVLRNTLRGLVIPLTTGHRTMTDPVPVRNRPEIIRSPRPRPPSLRGALAAPAAEAGARGARAGGSPEDGRAVGGGVLAGDGEDAGAARALRSAEEVSGPVGEHVARGQVAEGREAVGRPRPQVPVQRFPELRERAGAVRRRIVAAVRPRRAPRDRPGGAARPRAPGGGADGARVRWRWRWRWRWRPSGCLARCHGRPGTRPLVDRGDGHGRPVANGRPGAPVTSARPRPCARVKRDGPAPRAEERGDGASPPIKSAERDGARSRTRTGTPA